MDFEKLMELVGDNDEAKNFVKGVQETQETNVQTINKNENLINNLKDDLGKFKKGNELVKTKLGIDQLNEDSLNEALQTKNKGGDEKLIKEIENLKSELDSTSSKYEDTVKQYNSQIQELKVGSKLDDISSNFEFVDNQARKDAITFVKQQMKFNENNEPVFLNEDGTTKYLDGKPMGLDDAFKSIESERPYMFAPSTKGGSQSTSNDGGTPNTSNVGGDSKQREQYFKEKFNL